MGIYRRGHWGVILAEKWHEQLERKAHQRGSEIHLRDY
jgi:hypothetical protein